MLIVLPAAKETSGRIVAVPLPVFTKLPPVSIAKSVLPPPVMFNVLLPSKVRLPGEATVSLEDPVLNAMALGVL